MENKAWEDQLRNILGEYNATDPESSLGQDADAVNTTPPDPNNAADKQQGWKRIEASLDAADQAFDETLRHKIKQYHPAYDPNSWPVFLNKLADTRYLRIKLLVLKSVEVAIVLLLLLSAFNIERLGKMPFDSNSPNADKLNQKHIQNIQQENSVIKQHTPASSSSVKENKDFTQADQLQNSINKNSSTRLAENENAISLNRESESTFENMGADQQWQNPGKTDNTSLQIIAGNETHLPESLLDQTKPNQEVRNKQSTAEEISSLTMKGIALTVEPHIVPDLSYICDSYITEPLASADLIVDHAVASVPSPQYVKPISTTYTEFAVLTQVDYNALKMPEDRLYSSGKEIVFPSKGIMSFGFGAGFTIAIGHPVWALETGVIYNAKDFEPGRQLIVGGAFDNGSVEFEAMKMQIISLPVQYRYRFDHEGRFKTYGIAGGGFHVISQSDVDVQIKYHFATLAFGQNPNNDPSYAETIKETRRIREHIRDGAPFSTKSFVSVNAGLGMEYMLSEHKAIFFQAVAQYQIPNIAFSNNNGKHLRSVSFQAGIRGPLGK